MIKCIAIDDEPLALELLKKYINKIAFLNLVATCDNAFDAMEEMQKQQVDLIFIDIQMPELTGLQFISSLEKKPLAIVITAYKEFALESFDLDVVDYLLKPVPMDRFLKACNRAKDRFGMLTAQTNDQTKDPDHFFVNVDYSQVKLKFIDILWLKGYGDYLKFYLKNNTQPLVVRMSFKEIVSILPPKQFIRIHKSYMVAIDEITSIRKSSLFLGELEFSVGESYKESVEKLIG
ncbi:LytR/AlgR family response regulator transcription factor [Cyclobacterium marinum]|uniref:Two component transcriptional regulator, LytTR family n=1 Tax=Cyclobacterium marinum (strain ATCC 25205 / DSM 745 / LMG 13164 / NCIMB 1802) TaxID=880070 RepID=G0J4X8_CYCMS|nr:LytTR family DNA-binding domain-containing protein [Cyclobacterium marinum]AEL25972.1 two component transcriptional regulator, LytTR family [Cyclobacterium marinum DSM 745]MBI0399337.1 response regulator transcription factor [Cyclobacterium marinum]MBR9776841.1 response regulator transcription factor [Cytophagales bacterium]|tara:strand:+ start:93510 stop:94211 length:702 start_codon:yes stop_codon:yes gene_type:complete